jgi:ATP-dependent Clp protease ATP-binding subunit ClpA
VIDYAFQEARKFNHNYVGTEHLLLGLLREEEGVAAQILMNLGLHLEHVREETVNLLGPASGPPTAAHLRDQEYELKKKREAIAREWRASYVIDPSWLTWKDGAVAKLARAIATERRWQDLPALADALEAAGCTNADMLGHCRQPGEHGGNCWVVDLLLRTD